MTKNDNAISLEKIREAVGRVAETAFEKAAITGREAAFDEAKFNKAVSVAHGLIPLPFRLGVSKERLSGVMKELRGRQFGSLEADKIEDREEITDPEAQRLTYDIQQEEKKNETHYSS